MKPLMNEVLIMNVLIIDRLLWCKMIFLEQHNPDGAAVQMPTGEHHAASALIREGMA